MKPIPSYRHHVGDVVRLHRSLPLARAGEYVLLSVNETVRLARLRKGRAGRVASQKIVYVHLPDLCVFEETSRHYRRRS